jgi:hypothetical protein
MIHALSNARQGPEAPTSRLLTAANSEDGLRHAALPRGGGGGPSVLSGEASAAQPARVPREALRRAHTPP